LQHIKDKEEIKLEAKKKQMQLVNHNERNREYQKNQERNRRGNGCVNALLISSERFGPISGGNQNQYLFQNTVPDASQQL